MIFSVVKIVNLPELLMSSLRLHGKLLNILGVYQIGLFYAPHPLQGPIKCTIKYRGLIPRLTAHKIINRHVIEPLPLTQNFIY